MIIISFYLLLFIWISGFFYFFYRAAIRNNYVLCIAGFVPIILMVIYGVGGAILLTYEDKIRFALFEAYFSNFDILCVLIYSCVASVIFYGAFCIIGKGKIKRKYLSENWSNQLYLNIDRIERVTITLLCFDMLVRSLEVSSGVYVKWLAAFVDNLPWWKTTLFQLQASMVPILGVGLYCCSREKLWAKFALGILFFLILLEGDRSDILQILAAIILSYCYFNKIMLSFKLGIGLFFLIFIFFGLVGPFVQEVRYEIRDDRETILQTPAQLPVKLFSTYIPAAATYSRLYGDESRRSQDRSGTLIARLIRWPAFWASINARVFEGRYFRGIDSAIKTMSLIIPSVIYLGEKPKVEAGSENLSWYELFVPSDDPTSTVFLDAFAIGGVIGLVLLSLAYGLMYGVIARLLIYYWKSFGVILIFGLLNIVFITSNSFGTVFVRFRDSLFIIVPILLLYTLPRLTIFKKQG